MTGTNPGFRVDKNRPKDNPEDRETTFEEAATPTEGEGDREGKDLQKSNDSSVETLEESAWGDRLAEIGEQLQQTRERQGISAYQLHSWTRIPLHHIDAIERGLGDRLPPKIYVCGFIRRMADALGLDGDAMAESLPQSDPVKTALRVWEKPQNRLPFAFTRVQLYLGYAIVLGLIAVGLTWVSIRWLTDFNSGETIERQE
jgi:hypothetical protein